MGAKTTKAASKKTGSTGTAKRASKATKAASKKGAAQAKAAKPKAGAAVAAEKLIEEKDSAKIAEHANQILVEGNAATQSARVLSEIAMKRPDLIAPLVDRFVKGIGSENRRVVQTSADALPAIAKVAPARVAKHLDKLKPAFGAASDVGKDGLVRTFATLCAASVAYQKRLEPVLKEALGGADDKTLVTWSETVLPALKGEPHANARAVVEQRLPTVQRKQAQQIAEFLGIKLRLRPR